MYILSYNLNVRPLIVWTERCRDGLFFDGIWSKCILCPLFLPAIYFSSTDILNNLFCVTQTVYQQSAWTWKWYNEAFYVATLINDTNFYVRFLFISEPNAADVIIVAQIIAPDQPMKMFTDMTNKRLH